MKNNLGYLKTNRRLGFTLIEILVVVLLVGILASFSVPMFLRSVEESRSAEATTNLGDYIMAQETHFMHYGTYADNPDILDVGIKEFKYFTITEFGKKMTLTRTNNAGGDLGQWAISMTMPERPGEGVFSWECTPMPACKYLLPPNMAGGVVKSENK